MKQVDTIDPSVVDITVISGISVFTDELVNRLSDHLGEPKLVELYRDALRDNRASLRSFTDILVTKLSLNAYRENWSGPEDLDEICRVLINLQKQNAPGSRHSNRAKHDATPLAEVVYAVRFQLANVSEQDASTAKLWTDPPLDKTPWRKYAASAGFPTDTLQKAEVEILNILARVLIQGHGWGRDDNQKGKRSKTLLLPTRMSKHGSKLSPRTYQRAIEKLIALGLITLVSTDRNGRRMVTPAWWSGVNCDCSVAIWASAAKRVEGTESLQCRDHDAATSQKCRGLDEAPRPEPDQTYPKQLQCDRGLVGATYVRTSNILTLKHSNESTPRRRPRILAPAPRFARQGRAPRGRSVNASRKGIVMACKINLQIDDIKIRLIEDGRDGLVAWASCVVGGGLLLNNIAIRRGQDGRLFLTYPAKQSAGGSKYSYFRPISRDAAHLVDRAIMARIRELSAQYRPDQEGTASER